MIWGTPGKTKKHVWKNKQAEQQKTGAEDVRQLAEKLKEETRIEAKRASYFDLGEVCLEATIVLCSITLLSGSLFYWKISFVSTAIGLLLSMIAVTRRPVAGAVAVVILL
jgi:hypothetical protein